MVAYICDRCGYSTDLKGNIRRHFLKKKTCRVILKDVSIEQCFEEQLGEKMNSTLKNAENGPIHSKKTLKNAVLSSNFEVRAVLHSKRSWTPLIGLSGANLDVLGVHLAALVTLLGPTWTLLGPT